MKEYKKDTAAEYEDLVGYIAQENLPNNHLSMLLGMQEDYKPKVKPKSVNTEFPEKWQNMYLNFRNQKDYIDFMNKIGYTPTPRLKEFIYNPNNNEQNILDFLE
jgi:hypothetical protein